MRTRLALKMGVVFLLVLLGYVQHYRAAQEKDSLVTNYVYVPHNDSYVLKREPYDSSFAVLHTAYIKPGSRHIRRLMTQPVRGGISKIYGTYMSHPRSQAQIEEFMHNFGFYKTGYGWKPYNKEVAQCARTFDIEPHEWLVPEGGFKNFNEFFTRKLKKDVRPVAKGKKVLVSPADSKLFVIEHVQSQARFFDIKSDSFTLKSFLQSDAWAQEYDEGTLLIFRLSPYNYHRYHFPVSCIPTRSINISGSYESVHPVVYRIGINPLITNKRKITQLRTSFGTVLMIMVGAFNVGKICNTFFPGESYKKGDEAGRFEFGASTVVLLFKKGQFSVDKKFLSHSQQGFETVVKMGERVGVCE